MALISFRLILPDCPHFGVQLVVHLVALFAGLIVDLVKFSDLLVIQFDFLAHLGDEVA